MLRQVREGTHLVDGLTFAKFYKQHLQAKYQQNGGIGPMCYNALFLMILTKALSHSLRATICNWASCIGYPHVPHGPRYVACDCFLYLFQACMRQAPIVEKTPATCGSLQAHCHSSCKLLVLHCSAGSRSDLYLDLLGDGGDPGHVCPAAGSGSPTAG